ncbi:5110_t:CDS:1, partial [Dentiscutata erythropus]
FIEDSSEQSDSAESSQADNASNNGDNFIMPQLKNPKKHRGRGRPRGTKRIKASHEVSKPKIVHQRRCKKCGNTG